VRYRVESHPQQSVRVGMLCEAPYGTHPPADAAAVPIDWGLCGSRTGALLDMTARFASAPIGAWQTLSIPLACLASNGADLSHVSAPFAVASSGKFTVSFSEVSISRNAGKTTCH
jgi:beta-glucosidase